MLLAKVLSVNSLNFITLFFFDILREFFWGHHKMICGTKWKVEFLEIVDFAFLMKFLNFKISSYFALKSVNYFPQPCLSHTTKQSFFAHWRRCLAMNVSRKVCNLITHLLRHHRARLISELLSSLNVWLWSIMTKIITKFERKDEENLIITRWITKWDWRISKENFCGSPMLFLRGEKNKATREAFLVPKNTFSSLFHITHISSWFNFRVLFHSHADTALKSHTVREWKIVGEENKIRFKNSLKENSQQLSEWDVSHIHIHTSGKTRCIFFCIHLIPKRCEWLFLMQ